MAIELIHDDCMNVMGKYPDKYFDLAIVDPPYGINAPNMQMENNAPSRNGKSSVAVRLKKNSSRLQRLNQGGGKLKDRILNTSKIDWDYSAPPMEYFIELERVSKNQIIWGGNYFDLGPTRCVICWNKLQPWENFSQWEMAWTSFDSPARLFSYSNTGGNPDKMEKIHPTQKPIKLYRWLLHNYAKEGDKIFDSHGGSMSIAIACHDLKFDLTLCEIDKDYYDAGVKRFENHKKQLQLF